MRGAKCVDVRFSRSRSSMRRMTLLGAEVESAGLVRMAPVAGRKAPWTNAWNEGAPEEAAAALLSIEKTMAAVHHGV